MHRIIRAIVYATNEEEAFSKAVNIFDRLCDSSSSFDSYSTFKEKYATSRWGEITPIQRVCNEHNDKCNDCKDRFICYTGNNSAINEITETMNNMKLEFSHNLRDIRVAIASKSEDDLFEDSMFRYFLYNLGEYRGPAITLYDNDGEGIRTQDHLNNVLNKWECLRNREPQTVGNVTIPQPEQDLNIYVIPADFHY